MNVSNAIAMRTVGERLADRVVYDVPSWSRVGIIFAAHIVLGLIAARMPSTVNLHALAVFGIGMWWAFAGDRTRVAYVAAYIVGAEVFWRMSKVSLPWEFGKYAISAIFLLAMVQTRRIRGPLAALLYFAAMIPSIWMSIDEFDPSLARQYISFNLSGPFSLFVAAWFFSGLKISTRQAQIILLAVAAPILSVFAVAAYKMVTAPEIAFVSASLGATSGGYAANQVSSMFGLAALCLFLLLFLGRSTRMLKAVVVMSIFAVLVQSALTMSRSGIALAVGSAALATFLLLHSARARAALAGSLIVVGIIVSAVVIPRLDAFTEGTLTERFQELSTTGRADMAAAEIDMWLSHPVLGVGPGGGMLYRPSSHNEGESAAAHTEFTRMLGEHGFLGLFSMVMLCGMCIYNFFRTRGRKERAVFLAFISFSFGFMLVNAFRLAAPAFMIGFTCAGLFLNDRWRLRFKRPPESAKAQLDTSAN